MHDRGVNDSRAVVDEFDNVSLLGSLTDSPAVIDPFGKVHVAALLTLQEDGEQHRLQHPSKIGK